MQEKSINRRVKNYLILPCHWNAWNYGWIMFIHYRLLNYFHESAIEYFYYLYRFIINRNMTSIQNHDLIFITIVLKKKFFILDPYS